MSHVNKLQFPTDLWHMLQYIMYHKCIFEMGYGKYIMCHERIFAMGYGTKYFE